MSNSAEAVVKSCVRELGGICLDDVLPDDPKFKNADFVFEQHKVVAELKCLEKDIASTPEFQGKVNHLYEKWVSEGLVRPTRYFNLRDIPESCSVEYLALLKKQFKYSYLKKADTQIKVTKEQLGLQDHKGLLILVNEANTQLKPSALFNIIHHCFNSGDFSHINQFILVNMNMPASMPEQDNFYYWFAPVIEGREPVPKTLIDNLSNKWGVKLSEHNGVDIPRHTIEAPSYNVVDSIEHQKPEK